MTDEISETMTGRRDRARDIRIADCSATDAQLFLVRQVAMTPLALELKEELHRLMHCPHCVIHHPVPAKRVEFSFMYTLLTADPLQNFWRVANASCANCGVEEILMLDQPGIPSSKTRPHSHHSQTVLQNSINGPYTDVNDPWEVAEKEAIEQEMRQHTAQAQMSRQAAKSAALAAGYGMGQAGSTANMQSMANQMYGGVLNNANSMRDTFNEVMLRNSLKEMELQNSPVIIQKAQPPMAKPIYSALDVSVDDRSFFERVLNPKKGL